MAESQERGAGAARISAGPFPASFVSIREGEDAECGRACCGAVTPSPAQIVTFFTSRVIPGADHFDRSHSADKRGGFAGAENTPLISTTIFRAGTIAHAGGRFSTGTV